MKQANKKEREKRKKERKKEKDQERVCCTLINAGRLHCTVDSRYLDLAYLE